MKDLDPTLVFELLAVADGYVPAISSSRLDPQKGQAKLVLKPFDAEHRDPELALRGRVVNDDGKPVEAAIVRPFSLMRPDGTGGWGPDVARGIDEIAVTNGQGEFRIGVPEKDIKLDVQVEARYFARKNFSRLQVGKMVHELRIVSGVTVTGTVLKDGKPLRGIAMGLIQQDRGGSTWLGHFEIATDEDGHFTFLNIPPGEKYFVYGVMDTCRPHGAIPIQDVRVGENGTVKDIGSVTFQRGHRLSGRLLLSDGKPFPPGTRVNISRDQAWDGQSIVVAKDGSFSFAGLPNERYVLTPIVRGYHASSKNVSLDVLNRFGLLGKVDRDVDDLLLLLESGPVSRSQISQDDLKEYIRRRDEPLQGAPADAVDKK